VTAHHWTRPLSTWTPRAILGGLVVAGLSRLQLPALREAALVGAGILLWGAITDLADSRGYRLRGPARITPRRFTRRLRGDGVRLQLRPGRLARRVGRKPVVRFPRSLEAGHLLVMGDVGSGTSGVLRQVLQDIAARGERAIVYDPALAYVPSCYDPSRGDVLLNPMDQRAPFWTPADDLQDPNDALTVATSLVPDETHAALTDVSRRVLASLFLMRPGPDELAAWLASQDALDARLAGTPEAVLLKRLKADERTHVLAVLAVLGDAFRLLPADSETTSRWSAAEWTWSHRGWLFVTSPPTLRERLRPLTSLWVDLLLWRLMEHSGDGSPRTWVVLDDLASLNRLPHLYGALMSDGVTNMPIVLCISGRSLMDARYGAEAEAIVARPATKLFFRTREPRAAAWIGSTVGHVAVERLPATPGPVYSRVPRSALAHQIGPLILDSEVMTLPTGQAVLTAAGLVAPLALAEPATVVTGPSFLPRPSKPWPPRSPTAAQPEPVAATDAPPLVSPTAAPPAPPPEPAPRLYR
jgi:hypothetical protein